MFDSVFISLTHEFVGWLLVPTLGCLLVLVVMTTWELGILIGERVRGLRIIRQRGTLQSLEDYGRLRIERADVLARVAPMLGLMGTLIPLGPGIAALSRGQFEILAEAVSIAFDTTVVGLAVGILGFVIGRLRRRWYDRLIREWESAEPPTAAELMLEKGRDSSHASGSLATELRN